MTDDFARVHIGYDKREEEALWVCKHSIVKRSSMGVMVEPLVQDWVRKRGLYRRGHHVLDGIMYDDTDGKPFSTEFAFTRFLVPELMDFQGWALFCDCDFLFLCDIAEIWGLRDDKYAVQVVQHNHKPEKGVKMDGQIQEAYRRKNWSSFILWNCGHPANKVLSRDLVNNATGAFLHGFNWLADREIGELPETYNWLSGVSPTTERGKETHTPPAVVHYTLGGPWFEGYRDVPFAKLWIAERAELRTSEYSQAI